MARRVLLFVQAGEGRPKSVGGTFSEYMWRRSGEKIYELYRDTIGLGPVRLAFMYGKWAASLLAADRWWLVECENAEAGRRCINTAENFCNCGLHEGRILASGGRTK